MHNHFDNGLRVKALILERQPVRALELGVFKGENTLQLLSVLPGPLISLSDGPCPEGLKDWNFQAIQATGRHRFCYIQGVSYKRLKDADLFFDFVSLDTDHNGWTVDQELTQIERWMRPGGLLVVHDTAAFRDHDGFMRGYGDGTPYPLETMQAFPVPYGQVLQNRGGWKLIRETEEAAGAIALERQ